MFSVAQAFLPVPHRQECPCHLVLKRPPEVYAMTWPSATDYNAAVQNPQLCFREEDLRQGQAAGDLFGLPRPHSGNFADVYQIQGADGQSWAVKCFTRPVPGLRARYQAISEHLRLAQRAFMVEFQFLDEGICVRGQWLPLVKMRWVEGFRLNEFICEHLNKPVLLDKLAQLWVRLAGELRDADMAHGDLQHGNVLLVPGSKGGSLALKLIDYDGMFVPALAESPSEEVGHPNYQHPRRLCGDGYDRKMDRFSHLLIYTALRCLRIGGEELWQRYDNQENLLFREEDLLYPSKSRLLHELWEMPEREVRDLVGHLLLASRGALGDIPTLDELVDDSGTRPLSAIEEAQVNDLLSDATPLSRDRKGAVGAPLAYARGSDTSVRTKTQTKVHTTALTDTSTTTRAVKTAVRPVPPPLPQSPRRSAAEIELDARPPNDPATLPDPLVTRLSHPAWLATLGVIALISFFVVIAIVSFTVRQPTTNSVTDTKGLSQQAVAANLQRAAEKNKRVDRHVENVPPQSSGTTSQTRIANVHEDTNSKRKPEAANSQPKQADHASPKPEAVRPKPKPEDTRPKLSQAEQKPRGLQEKVHFRTVDHVQLAGTLYHGWKGKRGLMVLMLHDLGSNRSSPGWKRLAEALQAEGHTVLTFDFRGHGDSKKVSAHFWQHAVNKYLNSYKLNTHADKQPRVLHLADFPSEYRPWLIEDIAAARTYLDLLHDDPSGPVNTFNLVVLGAGQAAALGSLWLATEGLRYNGSETGNKIQLRLEEKRSILQAVWIGMADPLKLRPFGIHPWLEGAHAKPVVPITFIYGEDDIDTLTLLSEPIRKNFGNPFVVRGVRKSGQDLLDTDPQAAALIQKYLVKTLGSLPPTTAGTPVSWVPRKIKSLRSFWRMEMDNGKKKVVRWFVAKRVGEETLLPVPFLQLGIPIKGLQEPDFIPDEEEP
jgi:pimeloyl-ACP methyl ester carboxylesterase